MGWRECEGCGYRPKFCKCVNHRTAPGSELKEQMKPLTGRQARKLAPSNLTRAEHKRRCAEQGWRAR